MAASLRLLLSVLVLVSGISDAVVHGASLHFRRLKLPPKAFGPESAAFDREGKGPYVGVSDGRILKYEGPEHGFVEFATVSPYWTKELCAGSSNANLIPICGRPLGMAFNNQTGDLFIADYFFGLVAVGPKGGIGTQVAAAADAGIDGSEYALLDGLDVDPNTGTVYFSDAPAFHIANETKLLNTRRDSRLLKYEPKTKQVSVLLTGLSAASGLAVSKDGKFVLVSEFTGKRIRKFWLQGPKANTSEVLIELPVGHPDNISRTKSGDFWVAVAIILEKPTYAAVPIGLQINGQGKVLKTIDFAPEYNSTSISEVHEFNNSLFVSCALGADFVGMFRGPK